LYLTNIPKKPFAVVCLFGLTFGGLCETNEQLYDREAASPTLGA